MSCYCASISSKYTLRSSALGASLRKVMGIYMLHPLLFIAILTLYLKCLGLRSKAEFFLHKRCVRDWGKSAIFKLVYGLEESFI